MTFRLALAQVNPVVGDVAGNAALVLDVWRRAADAGADLVAFPELVLAGYPPEDLLFKTEFVTAQHDALTRIAAEGPPRTVAVVGFVRHAAGSRGADGVEWDVAVTTRDDLRNSAAVLTGGRVAATYDKRRLPNYGVFDEARYFTAGDSTCVVDVGGVPVAVTICEDLWTEQGPVAAAAARGARVVVNLNASPYHGGKAVDRRRWVRHHAAASGVWVGYVNAVGGQDELVFDGDSVVCAPGGEEVAHGHQFAEDIVVADLPVDGEGRPGRPAPRPRLDPVGQVWAALVLGTRDYCRKNGFTDAVVGLSGGIDSSVTAAVAVDALGADHVLGLSMPSPYTSEESLTDAKQLAEHLGIRLETLPIEPAMNALGGILGELFAGRPPDVTEENIQARIRGVLLMAVSNKFGHILLATGNKSELAVGYATLYGDMAGGFAVLKDCYKQLVYDLAGHRNARPDDPDVIPRRVLTRPPTAELRPGQRDEDSLPPYATLDPILRAYIEDDASVADIVAAGHDEETVRTVVAMVDRAEYKRRQAPPGVKISPRAFGKDRRLPVTNRWRGRRL